MAFLILLEPEHEKHIQQLLENHGIDTQEPDFAEHYIDLFECFLSWRVRAIVSTGGREGFDSLLLECLQGFYFDPAPFWYGIARYWDQLAWQVVSALPIQSRLDLFGMILKAYASEDFINGVAVTFKHELVIE